MFDYYKHLFYFPIVTLMGMRTKEYYTECLSLEKYTVEEIQKYKTHKLYQLLIFINRNIPYYKGVLPENFFSDANFNICEEFTRFPVVDKKIITQNYSLFTNSKLRSIFRSTSGSTGEPFVFGKDIMSMSYNDAMMHSVYKWHDVRITDREARIWGRPLSRGKQAVQKLKDIALRRVRLSAFSMDYSQCLKFFIKMQTFKPKYIYGYSSAIYEFISKVQEVYKKGQSLGISTVISTGEILFDFQRERIEEFFGCKVVNEYGSTENGIISFECEYGNMHITPTVLVEILNQDKNGYGDLVITELNSRNIPFVRYSIGDKGKLVDSVCKCGRPFQLMELSEGRVDSFIQCPNGSVVYDAVLAYALKGYARHFFAVQEKINLITINIVPNRNFIKQDYRNIKYNLKKHLGVEMNIKIQLSENIARQSSGKRKYFISHLERHGESFIGRL